MLLAGKAGFSKARHLTGRCCKVLVAPAASAALAENEVLIIRHILNDFVGLRVAYNGSARHLNNQILSAFAAAAGALTVLTGGSCIFSFIAKIHQRGEIIIDAKDDISALAAVTAVRTAGSHIFFTMESNGSVAAVTGLDKYFHLIYKHFQSPLLQKNPEHTKYVRDSLLRLTALQRRQSTSCDLCPCART